MLMIGERTADGFTVRRFVPIPNRHADPAERFTILTEDVRWLVGDSEVIGAIHSHPHGVTMPTDADLRGIEDGYIGAVFAGNTITSWYTRNNPLRSVKVSFLTAEGAAA
jgi:proteasome lid subunit RPN8/RPN11